MIHSAGRATLAQQPAVRVGDGRRGAYAKQKKLWQVPVEGGPAIELAVADWARGGIGAGTVSSFAPSLEHRSVDRK
jgi:hypothetical protein